MPKKTYFDEKCWNCKKRIMIADCEIFWKTKQVCQKCYERLKWRQRADRYNEGKIRRKNDTKKPEPIKLYISSKIVAQNGLKWLKSLN